MKPSVVFLIDHKQRDLMGGALVARHLQELGVDCHLEPHEAYRGVLAANRPRLIVFAQLTAGHLVTYSKRLRDLGVLTAVLTNEGISYEPQVLRFIVGGHHADAHIDHYFCWNNEMKRVADELNAEHGRKTQVHVVGGPRFDFYSPPWSDLYLKPRPAGGKPAVLFCTNFSYADFRDSSKAAEHCFGPLKDRLPLMKKYEELIDTHVEYRERALRHIALIARTGEFAVVLRPHPFENAERYAEWREALPAELRPLVQMDSTSTITELILNTDIQVSCETCTTSMESWIARKPAIEIILKRHPVFFHEEQAGLNPNCEREEDIVPMLKAELADPAQPRFAEGRRRHLQKWFHTTDGTASEQMARAIAAAVHAAPEPDWSRLGSSDRRRGLKQRVFKSMGAAYHFDPFLPLKFALLPKRYRLRDFLYRKALLPREAEQALAQLEPAFQRYLKER